ncbi:Glutaredoxin [Dillenia turbinata]|uniref:Glutaredoxin n=1 Tax=Dillenia turbinata TaxID=194707 RepID=A0AAN8W390_9MAGN
MAANSTDAAVNKVMKLASESPLLIFSKSSCCMCYSVKTIFNNFGANARVVELDQLPNGREMERALTRLGRSPTVPTVFIGHELIGGANEITSLLVRGTLGSMLRDAGVIWL